MLTVWSHPESYVLPPEEQGGKRHRQIRRLQETAENDPMTECRTQALGIEAESISTRLCMMMWGKDHWVGLVINLTCDKWRFWTATFP
ncbi:hypothetical protein Bca52824_081527 [Brassica carinata]|uniref:Uncharacterized protein n=1 Tax=Brassica carinata TaxID=52824 RepID=A0A8X7TTC4_BRACI|nr:hypothetical protein Bca52824_081527 [Brassica carinata]